MLYCAVLLDYFFFHLYWFLFHFSTVLCQLLLLCWSLSSVSSESGVPAGLNYNSSLSQHHCNFHSCSFRHCCISSGQSRLVWFKCAFSRHKINLKNLKLLKIVTPTLNQGLWGGGEVLQHTVYGLCLVLIFWMLSNDFLSQWFNASDPFKHLCCSPKLSMVSLLVVKTQLELQKGLHIFKLWDHTLECTQILLSLLASWGFVLREYSPKERSCVLRVCRRQVDVVLNQGWIVGV